MPFPRIPSLKRLLSQVPDSMISLHESYPIPQTLISSKIVKNFIIDHSRILDRARILCSKESRLSSMLQQDKLFKFPSTHACLVSLAMVSYSIVAKMLFTESEQLHDRYYISVRTGNMYIMYNNSRFIQQVLKYERQYA